MNRRQRLMATLRGEVVDRPPVCFYELNGLDENPSLEDPYNIYSHPSWLPLLELTRQRTDRIVMRSVEFKAAFPSPLKERTTLEIWVDNAGSRFTRRTVRAGSRALTELTRRDPDVNTDWTVEHLLKSEADVAAFLEIPPHTEPGEPDITSVLQAEAELGDSGIVMIDTPDALCEADQLFHLATYTLIAFTNQTLFHRLLEWFAISRSQKTERVAQALPGRLWRIYGPEYASPPYLPPRLFKEYVVRYDTPLIQTIQRYDGYARIHSHGRLSQILDEIVSTGCDGLDPIEPPPQGDVSLAYVRQRYGRQLVLFGNLESSDLENLPEDQFRVKVRTALAEGTAGAGRGFVLMPSACPYGRVLAPLALANYHTMVEEAENYYL
ncbi:MAG: uroporphyrinogen decarboxylase family protein [Anaerolineaceae bacterium]|nr:uroporphyrinogen decarboxylase family protein [Anaerolineaceae bacterium]